MKIAVTYENGEIFQHFGHTKQFKVYDIADGRILTSAIVNTNDNGHSALAGILKSLNTDVLICGGIGDCAQSALSAAGIQLYGGVSGNADQAVAAFLSGQLEVPSHIHCSHHEAHGSHCDHSDQIDHGKHCHNGNSDNHN